MSRTAMGGIEDYTKNPNRLIAFFEAVRKSLIQIGIILLLGTFIGYPLSLPVLRLLKELTGVTLAAFGLPETFFSLLGISLAIGAGLSMPFVLYKALRAVQQLYPFHRKMLIGFWLASVALFYLGAAFCVFVTLPFGVRFLIGFEGPHIEAVISVRKFVSFCTLFVIGFGFTFQLPLVMILFARIGALSAGMLSRYRRYAILAITIIAAIVTPTPDVLNLSLLAVPLYLLFELGLLGMRIWGKKS